MREVVIDIVFEGQRAGDAAFVQFHGQRDARTWVGDQRAARRNLKRDAAVFGPGLLGELTAGGNALLDTISCVCAHASYVCGASRLWPAPHIFLAASAGEARCSLDEPLVLGDLLHGVELGIVQVGRNGFQVFQDVVFVVWVFPGN